ncbi:Bro-N domain-containing protein [Pasteurella skyensis]|uniref:Bro-N domain-containing protein n=1 Tax=Phocoenobacter skyensis TaxID=97481 RepID=A0AAJ6NAK6_9PAST|nr:Bro-N domain-containing protein [Pasteurella skyensis]MDP8163255.1 Bro-N domain-containing protein [Pasteurella skyensis]MDP8173278.1 Bro-N domain-containing protein [Pasteurella skyensis]MDP8179688.1 Bro-N domain-containing protein [Pasteurella skyensis]MDP8182719.1 Bro-N domain-containing protein [Pasteurella skyensis]MDP8189880.1 Bro-N domain-containing protein [Pasteurella skyensis]
MKEIKLFEQKQVRTHWNNDEEKWYFSIIDVIEVLTGSDNPRRYWSDLKIKLKKEGSEVYDNIVQLKMLSTDKKMRLTDVANTEQLLRLIQSIPSPKAEPFKQWLAKVGYERIEELEDPEIGIDRLMETYLKKGYSKSWINQRLKSIEIRKELTDEWENRGVQKGTEYAILTDEITKAWSGNTVKSYKNLKGLKKENLRDNMTNMELVLNMLAEATTTEISKEKQPNNFNENKAIAKQGGTIAGNTRKQIEAKTGKKIVTSLNAQSQIKDKTKE